MMQPREDSPAAEATEKGRPDLFPGSKPTAQPGQQAQSGTSEPAVETAASKENAARQAFQQKKAEMKKKKRDVMGLWE